MKEEKKGGLIRSFINNFSNWEGCIINTGIVLSVLIFLENLVYMVKFGLWFHLILTVGVTVIAVIVACVVALLIIAIFIGFETDIPDIWFTPIFFLLNLAMLLGWTGYTLYGQVRLDSYIYTMQYRGGGLIKVTNCDHVWPIKPCWVQSPAWDDKMYWYENPYSEVDGMNWLGDHQIPTRYKDQEGVLQVNLAASYRERYLATLSASDHEKIDGDEDLTRFHEALEAIVDRIKSDYQKGRNANLDQYKEDLEQVQTNVYQVKSVKFQFFPQAPGRTLFD
ncbi:MAG: hypothetical protein R3B41_00990 [Candidatus Doudnabacteria bacterium]